MVRFARTCDPHRQLAGLYETKYARYKLALATLAPVWSKFTWQA